MTPDEPVAPEEPAKEPGGEALSPEEKAKEEKANALREKRRATMAAGRAKWEAKQEEKRAALGLAPGTPLNRGAHQREKEEETRKKRLKQLGPRVPVEEKSELTQRREFIAFLRETGLPKEMYPLHQEWMKRRSLAKLPKLLDPGASVEWSQKKLSEMLPEAVANLQWDLRNGTNKERSEATQTILRANGVAQKDAAVGQTPQIILHLGGDLKEVPFLQRVADAKKPGEK